jgi:ElaB/YqjD/DUF883 family membrane-anchored ribosome-binding protein
MSQKLQNRYAMQMAVQACLNQHRSLWAANPHISESADYIAPRLQRAQALIDTRAGSSTEGYTNAKNALLDSICARTSLLAKRLTVYARKTNNPVLLAEVDRPKRYFENGPELERIARCAAITVRAERQLAQLSTYKITMADIAALNADIESVRPLSGQRDAIGDEQQQLTHSIPELLQQVQEKLYELDDEITSFMDEAPDFQETYFNARKVTDRVATRERHND